MSDADPVNPDRVREIVQEELREADPERIAELAAAANDSSSSLLDRISRRGLLKTGAAAMAGGMIGSQSASAAGEQFSNASGTVGTDSQPLANQNVQNLDADTVEGVIGRFADQPSADVTHPQFGAVGDGNADDTQPIQDALNTGGVIRIPHGHTFRADGLVTPQEPVAVIGRGTIKRRDADTGSDSVLRIDGAKSLVRGITIDGSRSTTASTSRNEGLRTAAATSVVNVTAKNIGGNGGNFANGFINLAAGTQYINCDTENVGYAGFRTDKTAQFTGCVARGDLRGFQSNLQVDNSTVIISGGRAVADTNNNGSSAVTLESASNLSNLTGKVIGTHLSGEPEAVGIKMPRFDTQVIDSVTMNFSTTPTYAVYITDENTGEKMNALISNSKLDGQLRVLSPASVVIDNLFIDGRGHIDCIDNDGQLLGASINLLQNNGRFGVNVNDREAILSDVFMKTKTGGGTGQLYRIADQNVPPGAFSAEQVSLDNTNIIRSTTDDKFAVIDGLALNDGDPRNTGVWNGNGFEGVEVVDRVNNDLYVYRDGSYIAV